MVWRVLLLIYLWAFLSLGLSVWCFVLSHRVICPRWVRWIGGAAALAGLMLLLAAAVAREPLSVGYLVPLATLVLGAWAAVQGHRRRCPLYWLE